MRGRSVTTRLVRPQGQTAERRDPPTALDVGSGHASFDSTIGVLVACLSAGAVAVAAHGQPARRTAGQPASPARPTTGREGQAEPSPEGGRRVPGDGDGPLAPVSTSAGLADWAAATDVTPEHVAQRTGADKALAAVSGSTTVIDKTKALLKNEKQLDELTVRQLRKLLLTAAENPGTIPEVVAKRVELETKQSAILDGYTFCLQPKGAGCAKPITANDIDDILKKSRDLNERQRIWTVSKEIGRPLKPGPDRAGQAAQPGGARAGLQLVLRAEGRRLRHDRRRDDEAARRHAGDDEAALRRAALLGEEPAGRALQAAAAQADPGALDRQPLGAELAGARRGRQPRSAVQGVVAREHRQERGELLRLARVRQAAAVVLAAQRPLSGAARAARARRTATRRPGTSITRRTSGH